MKNIKNLVVAEKIVELAFPGIPDFKVRIKYQGRQAIRELAKKAMVHSIGPDMKKTEQLDIELFNKLFVNSCVLGWSGLTMENLSKLVLIDTPEDPKEEVEFSGENAEYLLSASESFDRFINSAVSDLDTFR